MILPLKVPVVTLNYFYIIFINLVTRMKLYRSFTSPCLGKKAFYITFWFEVFQYVKPFKITTLHFHLAMYVVFYLWQQPPLLCVIYIQTNTNIISIISFESFWRKNDVFKINVVKMYIKVPASSHLKFESKKPQENVLTF